MALEPDPEIDRVPGQLPAEDVPQQNPASDGENSEKVRQQFKKTTIAPTMGTAAMVVDPEPGSREGSVPLENGDKAEGVLRGQGEARGRLRRKRSIEEAIGEEDFIHDEASAEKKHARKRSRDSANEDSSSSQSAADTSTSAMDAETTKTAVPAAVKQAMNGALKIRPVTPDLKGGDGKDSLLTSPKNKRTRDQFLHGSDKVGDADVVDEGKDNEQSDESSKPAKRARDSSSPQPENDSAVDDAQPEVEVKSPPTFGFANTSAASPFTSLASPKSPTGSTTQQSQTSASAFAASGLSQLASSSASPFASAGASSSASPFGATAAFKPALSTFGDAKPLSSTTSSTFGDTSHTRATGASSPFNPTKLTAHTPATGASSPFNPTKLTAPLSFTNSGATTSGFSTLGQSTLQSGGFGGGFAAISKSSGGLSTFATPGAVGIVGLSGKPAKPFGAAEDDEDEGEKEESDDDEEEGEEKEGVKSPKNVKAEDTMKKDKRFYERDVETGEENENTTFTCRAKLFNFVTTPATDGTPEKKEWKERGVGTLKLNVQDLPTPPPPHPNGDQKESADKDSESGEVSKEQQNAVPHTRARLVMRADGSQRVILNSPVQKELRFGTADGSRPSSGMFLFQGVWDGDMQLLTLRMKQHFAEELWDRIESLKYEM